MWRTDAFIQGVDTARRAQWNGIPLCLGSYTLQCKPPLLYISYYHIYQCTSIVVWQLYSASVQECGRESRAPTAWRDDAVPYRLPDLTFDDVWSSSSPGSVLLLALNLPFPIPLSSLYHIPCCPSRTRQS